ncbi:YaaA family protein [Schaalia sp. ZJ1691]|uniref:YaaA family protein n=1 Tax=Schaalia sp. ZJ1691 TaxID=2709404 RepID=UPI0013EE0D69|nr:YaaA family protein [Schaalia sp. ZJ1691]
MKIIFSPAKDMSLDHPLNEEWSLSTESAAIVDALTSLSASDLQRKLKLNNRQLAQVEGYIAGFSEPTTYPALSMYNGLAYRWMRAQLPDFLALDAAEASYAAKHLRILSALYGPISPFTPVKPYRLDFTTSLPINGVSLKRHWTAHYPAAFEGDEVIFNAASDEFSGLLNPDLYRWVDLDFYEIHGDRVKRHSTIAKKARGQFVAYMITHRVMRVEDARNFDTDGYRLVEAKSSSSLLTFARKAE